MAISKSTIFRKMMKVARFPFASLTRGATLAGICSLFLALAPKGLASPEDAAGNALEVAKAWVAQLDAGHYDESYTASSAALHEMVSEDKWLLVLKALRTPWGAVVSRKVTSH